MVCFPLSSTAPRIKHLQFSGVRQRQTSPVFSQVSYKSYSLCFQIVSAISASYKCGLTLLQSSPPRMCPINL